MTVLPSMNSAALAHEFPISSAQRRELEAGRAFARAQLLRLRGSIDQDALHRSVRMLMGRHEVLRTLLRMKDGEWRQVVLDEPPLSPAVLDHSSLSDEAQQESVLLSIVSRLQAACTSPSPQGLFQATLVRLPTPASVLVLVANSLVLDSFSFELLLNDLSAIYAVETRAEAGPLLEPEVQYADCVLWEAAMAAAQQGPDSLDAKLKSEALATHTHRNGAPPVRSAYVEKVLSVEVASRLLSLPSNGSAILLAALAASMGGDSRHSMGLLISGREMPELERTLGPLQQTVTLEVAFARDSTAAASVAEAQRALEVDRGKSKPGPSRGRQPGFVLVEEPLQLEREFAPGVDARWMMPAGNAPDGARPGVTIQLLTDTSALRVGLWSWSLTEPALEAFAGNVLSVLERVCVEPDARLGIDSHDERSDAPPAMVEPSVDEASRDAPQGEIEKTLAEIWSAVLQVSSVGRHENFFDLGGHSLLAVRIGTRIERAFQREVPLNAILERPTIAEFALLLEETKLHPAGAAARRHRLVPIQEPAGGPALLAPLFWIPGGRAVSVLALREVSLLLGPDRPVYGVESRLPEEGEGFLSVPLRAQEYIDILREKQPQGPYLLAGFCVGGMVAFEMAQQLLQQGEEVQFLGLVQASMPGFPVSASKRRKMERQRRMHIARTVLSFLLLRVSPFHKRAPREKQQATLDRFAKLLTGWVGTSSQLPEVTQEVNGQTMKSYRPATYPGALHIFLAEDCFESAGIEPGLDPRRAWTAVAGGGAEIVVIPGDHVSMLTQAHARTLAEAMRAALPH